MTGVSFCFCSLLLVPWDGRTCSAWFLQGSRYLPQGFFTVGTQTSESACWSPSYSLPAPCFQVSFPARKVLVKRSPVISQELNWGWRMMHLKQRVWVPIYAPMRCFSVNVPNRAGETGLMRTWPRAWEGWRGPDLPGFLSLYHSFAKSHPRPQLTTCMWASSRTVLSKIQGGNKRMITEIVNKYWGSWLKNKFL